MFDPVRNAQSKHDGSLDGKSRVLVAIVAFLPVLVQASIEVPLADGGVTINAADPFVVIIVGLGVVGILRGHMHAPRWSLRAIPMYAVMMVAVFTVSLLVGYLQTGALSTWALINKYSGLFVLLTYAAAGAMLVSLVQNAQVVFSVCFISATAFATLLHFAQELPYNLGLASMEPQWTGNSVNPFQLAGFVGSPNGFAMLALVATALTISVWETLARSNRYIPAVIIAVLAVGIFSTASRAGIAAYLLVLLVAVPLRRKSWISLVTGVGIAMCAIALSILFAESLDLAKTRKLSDTVGLLAGGQPLDTILSSERVEGWREAVRLWIENPAFGAGLGSYFADARETMGERAQVIHNTLLWLLAETGTVGAFVFMLVFCHVLFFLFRRIKNIKQYPTRSDGSGLEVALLLSLVAFAVMSVFHEMMYQRALWLLAGLTLVLPASHGTASGHLGHEDERIDSQ